MNTHVFLITAKTNLHVGNEGGDEFTIIDKTIQRDPLTGLPCINSSSLKGAINEFCVNKAKLKAEIIHNLFGADKMKRVTEKDEKGNEKVKDAKKGEAIFFDAKLLYLPVQDHETLYKLAYNKNVIEMMNQRINLFDKNFVFPQPTPKEKFKNLSNEDFADCCSDYNLPIIARNKLENGESANLWYEQVLPPETMFYTIIQEEGDDLKEALNGQIVQIGANATIGYGYCKFELLNK